jgi:RHS repeat-associated protein
MTFLRQSVVLSKGEITSTVQFRTGRHRCNFIYRVRQRVLFIEQQRPAFRYGGQSGYFQETSPGRIDGLLYVRRRWLNDAEITTQWLTRAPIGFGGGDWNLYRYVMNNPIILSDPNGTSPNNSGRPNYPTGGTRARSPRATRSRPVKA